MDNYISFYIIISTYYVLGILYYTYIVCINKSKYTYLSAVSFDEECSFYNESEYAQN